MGLVKPSPDNATAADPLLDQCATCAQLAIVQPSRICGKKVSVWPSSSDVGGRPRSNADYVATSIDCESQVVAKCGGSKVTGAKTSAETAALLTVLAGDSRAYALICNDSKDSWTSLVAVKHDLAAECAGLAPDVRMDS